MTSADEDIKGQYDLLYESISKKLEQQLESLSSIDTKASILLAVIGVIFAGYFQLLTSSELGFIHLRWLVMAELLLFALAGFFVFKAFLLGKDETWRDDPKPKKLLEHFAKHSDEGEYGMKDEIIKSMSESYEANFPKIDEKYAYLRKGRLLLYLGITILIAHLSIILFPCLI